MFAVQLSHDLADKFFFNYDFLLRHIQRKCFLLVAQILLLFWCLRPMFLCKFKAWRKRFLLPAEICMHHIRFKHKMGIPKGSTGVPSWL